MAPLRTQTIQLQARAGKKYRRSCDKDAQCAGCEKWFHYLMECRECKVPAYTSCLSDLRAKLSPLQEAKMHEAWLLSTHKQSQCKHHPCAAKKYRRPCCKDAQCDGCGRDFRWLMICRKCELRACASCTSDLRERSERLCLQEYV